MKTANKLIFGTSAYQYLSKEVIALDSFEEGKLETKIFPDGEMYHRILTEVEDKEVILIGGTIDDASTMELFDVACAMVQYGVVSLTLVIPFFGYSTMERAVKSGEIVKAKTRALLLSAVPRAPKGNKIMFIDLHTEGLPHYFENGLRPVHIYAKELVMQAVRELASNEVVLASTDAGRAKWIESLANDMGINAAFVFKRRISGTETQITSISADVKGKDVVIYDDMIRTGGSIVNAARAYKNAGANDIFVITTHGLFSGGGFERIKKAGIIKKVVTSNTHPNSLLIKDELLEVKSVATLIKNNIYKNY